VHDSFIAFCVFYRKLKVVGIFLFGPYLQAALYITLMEVEINIDQFFESVLTPWQYMDTIYILALSYMILTWSILMLNVCVRNYKQNVN
jgi:hypothetical protein